MIGIWPANGEGDDILLFDNEARSEPIAVLHTLRQQLARREGRANVALADFVARRARARADYIGAFAVTTGLGEDAVVERFKHANDDYSAIMAEALADRLAEALRRTLAPARTHGILGLRRRRGARRRRSRRREISRHTPGARLPRATRSQREGGVVSRFSTASAPSACG